MNVVAFERKFIAGAWSEAELNVISSAVGGLRPDAWETGLTEAGDAQLYLLGPQPDQEIGRASCRERVSDTV